ncbi:MAG: hypothetical protein ACSHX8_08185 [Opitutaceae bacterium]
MSNPIWPVVTENLAEQLSAVQGGVVHPTQLLPYLPVSLGLIEQTLDGLTDSERVEKETQNGLTVYLFKESFNKPVQKFAPRVCVYSNEPLPDYEYAVLAADTRKTVEAELSIIAQNDIWPADAIWEHELLYLVQNLASPTSTSAIAGHARLSFKKVELHLNNLKERGMLRFSPELQTWDAPSSRYPKPAYVRNQSFIRQFPGAIKEELETRLVKALSAVFIVLFICLILAFTARFPFPLVAIGGTLIALYFFFKIIKAPAKPIPELY